MLEYTPKKVYELKEEELAGCEEVDLSQLLSDKEQERILKKLSV